MPFLLPFLLVAALVLALPGAALSQGGVFEALKGKSILLDYHESFAGPRGSFRVVWRDRLYVSSEGRIFHRIDARSGNPRASGGREVVGESGGGQRGSTIWNGRELVRDFVNPRSGNRGRQVIHVTGSGDNLSCSVSFVRFNLRQQGTVEKNGCQIVPGNVFAR